MVVAPSMCSICSVCSLIVRSLRHPRRHQIDQRENEHPDQIDEVPVQAADLDVLRLELTSEHRLADDTQVNHAEYDVRHMQSRERKERAAELRDSPWVVRRRHML